MAKFAVKRILDHERIKFLLPCLFSDFTHCLNTTGNQAQYITSFFESLSSLILLQYSAPLYMFPDLAFVFRQHISNVTNCNELIHRLLAQIHNVMPFGIIIPDDVLAFLEEKKRASDNSMLHIKKQQSGDELGDISNLIKQEFPLGAAPKPAVAQVTVKKHNTPFDNAHFIQRSNLILEGATKNLGDAQQKVIEFID